MVPVPGRPGQGIHAAGVLAKKLAGLLAMRFTPCLRFCKTIRPQHELSRTERLCNLRGSLAALDCARSGRWLLVDDVYTTGATVQECSRALKRAGASGVDVITLARREDGRWPQMQPESALTPEEKAFLSSPRR
ncbi:MAG: hypothetical protein AB1439_03565 [candidate division FCPU426 bacterium]